MLEDKQRERYDRNLRLRDFSEESQERLFRSRVLLVGVGGLGSPVSLYLTAIGIGHITVMEPDTVELNNLQRQIILDTESIGRDKADVARDRLEKLNPDVEIEMLKERFERSNARRLVSSHDMTVDASDNFPTKFLVNDASITEKKPFSIAAVSEFHGQTSTFIPGKSPCYRCLFKEPEEGVIPSTAEVGVFSTLPGIMGTIQATETVKVLLRMGKTLAGNLLLIDALEMEFQTVSFNRNSDCPACGENRTIDLPK